jgi:hypothetical protein
LACARRGASSFDALFLSLLPRSRRGALSGMVVIPGQEPLLTILSCPKVMKGFIGQKSTVLREIITRDLEDF